MNINQTLTCKHCKKIFKDPITLNCCGKTICKKDIDELLSNENKKCPFCDHDIQNQSFNINEILQALIEEIELPKFKIKTEYESIFKNFKEKIDILKAMHSDPENTINKKFSELRRLVDIDRDKAKGEIDRLADGIVIQLNAFESEFKFECKSKTDSDYESIIENMSNKLNEYEKCLNSVRYSDEHQNNSSKEISKAIDVLNNEIKEYENRLFKFTTIEYEPIKNVINFKNIFGKLLVRRNKFIFFEIIDPTTGTAFPLGSTSPFSTGFGGFSSTTAADQPTSGTTIKFSPFLDQDQISKKGVTQIINTAHQSISAMKYYERKSIDELRWEDYQANRKFPAKKSFQFDTSLLSTNTTTLDSTIFTFGRTSGDLFNRTQRRSIFESSPTGGISPFTFGGSTTTSDVFGVTTSTHPASTGGIFESASTTATTRSGIFDSVEPKPS